MRNKRLLATILLGVGFCLMSVTGYGEVEIPREYLTVDFFLQKARIDYMMDNPSDFLGVNLFYDPVGERSAELFPENVDTTGKVGIVIFDNRGISFNRTGPALLKQFKEQLETIYVFIGLIATDMNDDIIAEFVNKKGETVGYFYQGEYHLWEE